METNKILNNISCISKGDRIAIVAPSDLVLSDEKLKKGIDFLTKLGLKVTYSKEIFDSNKTSYENKAKEINRYFSDKKVKAIICAQGGDSAEHILKYLDYESIKLNPKIFMGLSDITVIMNALYSQSNLITFHGPDVIFGLGKFLSEYTQNSFIDRLMNGGNKLDYDHNMDIIQSGKCEGILIGGNLRCLAKLADTDFFPNNNLPKILFFESLSLTIEDVKDKLEKLKEKSLLNNAKGIILGNFKGITSTDKEKDLFQLFKEEFPTQSIVFIDQFGHISKNTILPIGANCIINTSNKDLTICYNYTARSDNYPFCLFTIPPFGKKVVWEVTNRCNYACKHCCNFSGPEKKQKLNLECSINILNNLVNWGVTDIYFSGGEPFTENNFMELVSKACEHGIRVSIASNCSLVTEKTAPLLKNKHIEKIHTSLDGHNAKINSKIRGNTFYQTISGIKILVKNNIPVRIGHVVFKDSLPHLEKMVKLAIKLGVNEVVLSWLVPVGRLKENPSLFPDIDFDKFIIIVENLQYKYEGKMKIFLHRDKIISNQLSNPCPGIDQILFINPEGKVSPCSWLAKINQKYLSNKSLVHNSLDDVLKDKKMIQFQMENKHNFKKGIFCPIFKHLN